MTTIANEIEKDEAIARIALLKQVEPGSPDEEELMRTVSAVAGYVAEREHVEQ